MTTDDLKKYYAGLLIIQYIQKPAAFATVKALVDGPIMDQILFAIRDGFNIDNAIGVQLDVIAKIIGVSRKALTFSGQVILDDNDLRLMIKMKIIQNNSTSSLSDIQDLIQVFFPTSLRVFDYKNMHMDYIFDSTFGSHNLAEAFVRQGLLPRPIGVQLGTLIYVPGLTNIFGFRTYDLAAMDSSPFNSYDDYQTNRTWLSYTNGITG